MSAYERYAHTAVLPDENLTSKLQSLESKFTELKRKVDSIESKTNHKLVRIA
jgi:hypothetical protein